MADKITVDNGFHCLLRLVEKVKQKHKYKTDYQPERYIFLQWIQYVFSLMKSCFKSPEYWTLKRKKSKNRKRTPAS